MRFFKAPDEKAYDKARKRLDKVDRLRVQDWAETSLWTVQEGLEGARRDSDPAALQQARLGVVGLLAAVDSLLDRQSLT